MVKVEFLVLGAVSDNAVGEKVTIAHVDEPGTTTALAIVEGSDIKAYAVASESGLKSEGTISGDELFNKVPEKHHEGFEGKIAEIPNARMMIVDIDLDMFAEKKEDSTNSRTEFELTVSGSIRSYQAKSAVIKAFRSGVRTKVALTNGEAEDNGILLTYDGMLADRRGNPAKAGIVRPAGNEELEELKQLLEAAGKLEGQVTAAEDSSYTLLVKVDHAIVHAVATGQPIPNLDNVKARLVSEGIKSEEIIDDVVSMLQHYGVDADTIIEVLETYKAYEPEYEELIPKKPTTEFIDEGYYIFDTMAYVLEGSRKGIRLVGPKGTGKNLLEEWAGYLLQRPLFDQPVTIDTDRYELLGSKTADVHIDENGNGTTKIVFDPENLIKAMECGGIINLDEVNMASASVMALMNPVLDRRSYIDVSGYGRVVADENFMVFATMNEAYAGTQELNAATQDRFATLIFDANKSIMPILDSHEDTKDADDADKKVANQLFEGMSRMIQGQDLSKDAETIRGFIAAVSIARRIGIRRGLIQNVVNNVNDEDTRQQIRDFIVTII